MTKIHYPPGRKKLPFPPEKHFMKIIFLEQKAGAGEDYGVEELPKFTRVLVTRFDKFYHFCNFYIFGLGFVAQ